jgi:hypothetical protein
LRVLKRKCGWSCIFRAPSSAFTSCVWRREAASSRSRYFSYVSPAHARATSAAYVRMLAWKFRRKKLPSAQASVLVPPAWTNA